MTLPGYPNRQTRYVRYQLVSIFGNGERIETVALAFAAVLFYLERVHRERTNGQAFDVHSTSEALLYAPEPRPLASPLFCNGDRSAFPKPQHSPTPIIVE